VAGRSSNSKYSLLGRIRAGSQTISYEVYLAILILSPLILFKNLDLGGGTYLKVFLPGVTLVLVSPPKSLLIYHNPGRNQSYPF
jgi:NADH:ubiquinone oxidoreductase subunit H